MLQKWEIFDDQLVGFTFRKTKTSIETVHRLQNHEQKNIKIKQIADLKVHFCIDHCLL